MSGNNWEKFVRHFKAGGLFYAIFRGFRYVRWRNQCKRLGIDYRTFSK